LSMYLKIRRTATSVGKKLGGGGKYWRNDNYLQKDKKGH